MMQQEPIVLTYITDNHYVVPTILSITSLIENRKTSRLIEINVITNNLSAENKNYLEQIDYSNVSLTTIDAGSLLEQYSHIAQNHWVPNTAMLKFFLPKIFPHTEKMIYIDGDTLILDDIEEFYDTDIDTYYAGVVQDSYCLCELGQNHIQTYAPECKAYFNSGVLLLNLKKLRDEHVSEKLIEEKLKQKSYYMDQDTLNNVFNGKTKLLSYRYNCLYSNLTPSIKPQLADLFGVDLDIPNMEIFQLCTIMHFPGKDNPWEDYTEIATPLYKKYHKKSVLKHQKLSIIYSIHIKMKMKKLIKKIFPFLPSLLKRTSSN